MFSGLSLRDSFKYVATQQEWTEFAALGDVNSVDLWIYSMDSDPANPHATRIRRYEILWSKFAAAAKRKLLSGEWTAAGFDPDTGAQPQQIDPGLWQSLEFRICETGADGAGFKFVNLLVTSKLAPVPEGPTTLMELLDLVATAEEAAEYEPLKFAAQRAPVHFLGDPETDYDRANRLCTELQDRLWSRILPNLVEERWVAEGYPHGSLEAKVIPGKLWPVLHCDFTRNEVYSDGGSDLHLYHVTVIQSRLKTAGKPHASKAKLRHRLIKWIRTELENTSGPQIKAHVYGRACDEFAGETITPNLFSSVWQAEMLDDRRQSGRPKI